MARSFSNQWWIDCPPSTVFDLMADLRSERHWNRDSDSVELTSDGPVARGSTFHLVAKGNRHNDVTIAEFARPGRIEFAGRSDQMDVDVTYTFTPEAGGTRMQGTFEPRPKGVMRLLLPLLMPVIRRDLDRKHTAFKNLCEAHDRESRPTSYPNHQPQSKAS